MRSLILTVILGVWSTLAMAEDIPEPYDTYVSKGVFCDSADDVRSYLSMIELEQGVPKNPPESCEGIVLMFRIKVTVKPIEWYETPQTLSLIASLTDSNGVAKYGWVKFKPNPSFQPVSLDPDA